MKNDENLINFALTVSENLYNKIDGHVRVLRHIKKELKSKKYWIIEAIQEKIDREKEIDSTIIPKEKCISFKIDKSLGNKIIRRIELIKKFRKSFSRKRWILEAIFEKMEEEEHLTRKILSDSNHAS